ncbi:hypothetical protein J6590_084473 [Homalodisca vitripennis]|nr:hypothetical protein J6590_084473 [Homalodisca vitripennis]
MVEGTNGLKVISEPLPMAGQAGCFQGQDRSAVYLSNQQPRSTSNNKKQFLPGGRIDHAHHYNNAYRALDETLVLEAALLNILSLVDLTETLFVVTSDHSNVMTFGGLSTPRGNPILGADTKVSDVDGLPYSTLLYGTGPGYARPRVVPSNQTSVTEERNVVHASAVARQWATHGGEDVPVYAQGPLASVVFKGVVEQSYIPHAIAYVLCLGEYSKRCKTLNQTSTKQPQASTPSSARPSTRPHQTTTGQYTTRDSLRAVSRRLLQTVKDPQPDLYQTTTGEYSKQCKTLNQTSTKQPQVSIPHAIAYVLCPGEYSKQCKTLNQTSTKQPQVSIPHAIAYVLCPGEYSKQCKTFNQTSPNNHRSGQRRQSFGQQPRHALGLIVSRPLSLVGPYPGYPRLSAPYVTSAVPPVS